MKKQLLERTIALEHDLGGILTKLQKKGFCRVGQEAHLSAQQLMQDKTYETEWYSKADGDIAGMLVHDRDRHNTFILLLSCARDKIFPTSVHVLTAAR